MGEKNKASMRQKSQKGFTLTEMMVTIAIGGILMGIAVNAYADMRERTRAKSVAEEINSTLTAARLQALSSRLDTSVAFDFANDSVTSPLWPAGPRVYPGVDLVAFKFTGCQPKTSANNAIKFKSTGGASGSPGVLGNMSILVRPTAGGSSAYYLVVNGTGGRVRMMERCP